MISVNAHFRLWSFVSDLMPCFWPIFADFQNEAVSLWINNLKGTSSQKKLSSNERAWKMPKKWAITDHNVPDGSRDILFQSQEFEQDRCRHFVDF